MLQTKRITSIVGTKNLKHIFYWSRKPSLLNEEGDDPTPLALSELMVMPPSYLLAGQRVLPFLKAVLL
jgi:hypothetical protein